MYGRYMYIGNVLGDGANARRHNRTQRHIQIYAACVFSAVPKNVVLLLPCDIASSHTHRLCFHYETYIGISQYRTVGYYMYTKKHDTSTQCYTNVDPPSRMAAQHWVDVSCLLGYMLYTCCIASERGMLLTEHRRFTTLWSSVMSVDCTLFCAVESFGQSCKKIQTVFISCGMEKYSTCPRNKVFA